MKNRQFSGTFAQFQAALGTRLKVVAEEQALYRASNGNLVVTSRDYVLVVDEARKQVVSYSEFSTMGQVDPSDESAHHSFVWWAGCFCGLGMDNASTACSKANTRLHFERNRKQDELVPEFFGDMPELSYIEIE